MQGSSDYLLIHVRFNIILATPARAKRDQIRNKDMEVEDLNNCSTYVEVLERFFHCILRLQ